MYCKAHFRVMGHIVYASVKLAGNQYGTQMTSSGKVQGLIITTNIRIVKLCYVSDLIMAEDSSSWLTSGTRSGLLLL